MKIARLIVLASCCLAIGTMAVAAEAKGQKAEKKEAMQPQPVPPEIEKFDWMVGTWKADMQWEASEMGPAGRATGKDTVIEGPGGQSLIANFESRMKGEPYEGHGVITYDPQKKQYVMTWSDSHAPGLMVMKGRMKGDELVYEGESTGPDGKPAKHRATVSNMTPDSYTFTMERKDKGAWKESFTIDYTKEK